METSLFQGTGSRDGVPVKQELLSTVSFPFSLYHQFYSDDTSFYLQKMTIFY